jgi:hypothetical protein
VGQFAAAVAVNRRGTFVGQLFVAPDCCARAFVATANGDVRMIGPTEDLGIVPYAINDRGEIAGTIGAEAAWWTASGGVVPLADPGGGYAAPVAINAHGDIAGNVLMPDSTWRAVLWRSLNGATTKAR